MTTLVTLDSNGNVLGVPPQDVKTITADTLITDWVAIKPATDVDIYFSGTDEITFSIGAGEIILVHELLMLSANTLCLVY